MLHNSNKQPTCPFHPNEEASSSSGVKSNETKESSEVKNEQGETSQQDVSESNSSENKEASQQDVPESNFSENKEACEKVETSQKSDAEVEPSDDQTYEY